MTTLRLVLGDQLSHSLASLRDADKTKDVALMCEVVDEATYVRRHQKKIAFVLSAMRHFADSLEQLGYQVDYVQLDDADNTGSISSELKRAAQRHNAKQVIVTEPGEFRLLEQMQRWQAELALPVEILEDDRFLCGHAEFSDWLAGRKQPRMEHFYRHMRKSRNVLMDAGQPVGGAWNYDSDNRKPPKTGLNTQQPTGFAPDKITQAVISLTAERFGDHFGELEPFDFAVSREDALLALEEFIEQRLPLFGDYQDAMLTDQPWMFHAHLALYLNNGLLEPMECIEAAERAFNEGNAPINAVEGFIRQIIGWREYIRGIYFSQMPAYKAKNFFQAARPLPEFFWTGETELNCLHQCIQDTARYAYAHHIQRLMVIGNFCLLAGIDPQAVNEWFLIVYADAYEWVELPNVTGMALFADGGLLASKPYAASGAYINRMSDYCKSCRYKVKDKLGEDACPFNYLYWDFLDRNRQQLANNPRIGMLYRTLDKMKDEQRQAIQHHAELFLRDLSA